MESLIPLPRKAPSPWPTGFERIPDEPWARAPIDPFALAYDRLGSQGWYANFDPTVAAVAPWLEDGALVVDYSGGTGLLADRLLAARPDAGAGLLNADASAKFLRLAAEKAKADPRLAVRLLPSEGGRLRTLPEAAAPLAGRVDGLACANAVHLYPDVREVAATWAAMLRPGGRLHVQSGNLAPAGDAGTAWIIDSTVHAIGREAQRLVAADPALARHRAALADAARMAACERVRRRWFPPARTAEATVADLAAGGFEVGAVRRRDVTVETAEWAGFLAVYHEGVLPWVGTCREVDGRPADAAAVQDRQRLIAEGLRAAVGPRFRASWTYVDATRL
jgi:SAM-dependent methyltransferase